MSEVLSIKEKLHSLQEDFKIYKMTINQLKKDILDWIYLWNQNFHPQIKAKFKYRSDNFLYLDGTLHDDSSSVSLFLLVGGNDKGPRYSNR